MSATDLSFSLPPRVVVARAMRLIGAQTGLQTLSIVPSTDGVKLTARSGLRRADRLHDYSPTLKKWAGEALANVTPLAVTEMSVEFTQTSTPSDDDDDATPDPNVSRVFARLALHTSLIAADLAVTEGCEKEFRLRLAANPIIEIQTPSITLTDFPDIAAAWIADTASWRQKLWAVCINFTPRLLSAHERLDMTRRLAEFDS
jgi:hypothetical protein